MCIYDRPSSKIGLKDGWKATQNIRFSDNHHKATQRQMKESSELFTYVFSGPQNIRFSDNHHKVTQCQMKKSSELFTYVFSGPRNIRFSDNHHKVTQRQMKKSSELFTYISVTIIIQSRSVRWRKVLNYLLVFYGLKYSTSK